MIRAYLLLMLCKRLKSDSTIMPFVAYNGVRS